MENRRERFCIGQSKSLLLRAALRMHLIKEKEKLPLCKLNGAYQHNSRERQHGAFCSSLIFYTLLSSSHSDSITELLSPDSKFLCPPLDDVASSLLLSFLGELGSFSVLSGSFQYDYCCFAAFFFLSFWKFWR